MVNYVYDIETYPSVFTCYIGNCETRKCKSFEISYRKDERNDFFEYLRMIYKTKGKMIGFNNIGFDYPVIHYLLTHKDSSANLLYRKAMDIIESDNKFIYLINDKDMFIPQIDLYKIHHFDNKARSTSLKMLEFNMQSDNIEDLPFPVGKELSSEEIDILLKYNKHDMFQTFLFYEKSKDKIIFRENLSKKYKRNFINYNDTKIGKDYFIMELEKNNPGCCYKKNRKPNQSIRHTIKLKDCILPYVKFERPEFKAILDWFKKQEIKETKGVFTDILESDLGEVAKYAKLRKKRQRQLTKPNDKKLQILKEKHPSGWLSEEELKSGKISYWWNWNVADSLNIVVNGLEIVFGVGGLHASIESSIIHSDDEFIINDQDVSSYYPNLAIKNKLYPEHLGDTFCDIYEDIYNQRKQYAKGTAENAMLKLALNGTYGASNDKYSPFFDPKFTMSITINGQLTLCMLAEQLLKIDSLSIIQCNTDGLTYKVHRNYYQDAIQICEEWQNNTKLDLEGVDYKSMYIRDVNNYIAVSMDGKIKRKGAYEYENLDWNKNFSSLIIQKAASAYLLEGMDISEFIKNHSDIHDFMLRTKVPRNSRLVLVNTFGEEEQLQNICRYYMSDNGGELVKIMPPIEEYKTVKKYIDEKGEEWYASTKAEETRFSKKYKYTGDVNQKQEDRRLSINSGWKIKPCNNIKDFSNDINYNFYIEETNKLINFT